MAELSLGGTDKEESLRRSKAAPREAVTVHFAEADIGKQYGHGSDLIRAHLKPWKV